MTYHPVVEGFLSGLTEKVKLRPEEWAADNIILPREVSSMPGKHRAISYQKEFFEALADPSIEVIVLMTSSQVGKTNFLSSTALYYVVEDPSRILFIQPKDDAAEEFKKERIDPIIAASPEIRKALDGYVGNKSMDQTNYLAFPGGFLDFKGANSPTNLAGKPIRILLMDEIDRYPGSVGGEGDGVTIAMARTKTERSRKTILVSTPKDIGRSRIHKLFLETDQRRRFLTCEECDHEQYLKFDESRVQRTKSDGVCYFCEGCGCPWDRATLRRLERHGRWKATATSKRRGWVGFHIWEGYSPFSDMEKVLEQWEGAKGDATQEQTFCNTVLGEPYEGKLFKRTTLESILERRERIISEQGLPPGCLCVTASLDLQGDRAEVMHMGHGLGDERWVLGIERIYGDVLSAGLWSRVTEQLNRTFKHASGNTMVVEAACLDAGFKTNTVIDYVIKANSVGMNCYAIIGRSGQGRKIWEPTRTPASPGKLWAVGIDEGKTDLMMSLSTETPGEGYFHINGWRNGESWSGLTDEMCEQFLAEQCEVNVNRNGMETRKWVNPKRKRNEAIDLSVYNFAAFKSLGIDLVQRMELIYSEPLPKVDVRALARQMRGEK